MDSRLIFIAACLRGEASMSAICAEHGVSRRIGYKWLDRYRQAGAAGLVDLSSVRHTLAHTIDPTLAAAILALRDDRPTWGPEKLLARLRMDHSETAWPAASTIGDLLRRSGRSKPRPRRQLGDPKRRPLLTEPSATNEIWTADFKGWFRTRSWVRCEPFR